MVPLLAAGCGGGSAGAARGGSSSTAAVAVSAAKLVVARRTLERWTHDEIDRPHSPKLSDAAMTLWLRAVDRLRRAAALGATRSETQITIDGNPAAFVTLTTPSGRWVAVRHHADLTVTIAARDLDPPTVTIDPIPDPAATLLGPEPPQP